MKLPYFFKTTPELQAIDVKDIQTLSFLNIATEKFLNGFEGILNFKKFELNNGISIELNFQFGPHPEHHEQYFKCLEIFMSHLKALLAKYKFNISTNIDFNLKRILAKFNKVKAELPVFNNYQSMSLGEIVITNDTAVVPQDDPSDKDIYISKAKISAVKSTELNCTEQEEYEIRIDFINNTARYFHLIIGDEIDITDIVLSESDHLAFHHVFLNHIASGMIFEGLSHLNHLGFEPVDYDIEYQSSPVYRNIPIFKQYSAIFEDENDKIIHINIEDYNSHAYTQNHKLNEALKALCKVDVDIELQIAEPNLKFIRSTLTTDTMKQLCSSTHTNLISLSYLDSSIMINPAQDNITVIHENPNNAIAVAPLENFIKAKLDVIKKLNRTELNFFFRKISPQNCMIAEFI